MPSEACAETVFIYRTELLLKPLRNPSNTGHVLRVPSPLSCDSGLSSHIAALGATAKAASNTALANVCTVSNVQAALPAKGTLLGIDLLPSTVTATTLCNATSRIGSTLSYTYST
jgi:hypothetical protein